MTHVRGAVNSPAAANPVVAVFASEADVRSNDALFRIPSSRRRRTADSMLAVGTEVGSVETFVGFAMNDGKSKHVAVGVSGAFSTHALPSDLAKLAPGDRLTMRKSGTIHRVWGHGVPFQVPHYTKAAPEACSPIRFLHRESESSMRILVTKGGLGVKPAERPKPKPVALIPTSTFSAYLPARSRNSSTSSTGSSRGTVASSASRTPSPVSLTSSAPSSPGLNASAGSPASAAVLSSVTPQDGELWLHKGSSNIRTVVRITKEVDPDTFAVAPYRKKKSKFQAGNVNRDTLTEKLLNVGERVVLNSLLGNILDINKDGQTYRIQLDTKPKPTFNVPRVELKRHSGSAAMLGILDATATASAEPPAVLQIITEQWELIKEQHGLLMQEHRSTQAAVAAAPTAAAAVNAKREALTQTLNTRIATLHAGLAKMKTKHLAESRAAQAAKQLLEDEIERMHNLAIDKARCDESFAKLSDTNTTLKTKIAELESQHETQETRAAAKEDELTRMRTESASLQQSYATAFADADRARYELETSKIQIATTTANLNTVESKFLAAQAIAIKDLKAHEAKIIDVTKTTAEWQRQQGDALKAMFGVLTNSLVSETARAKAADLKTQTSITEMQERLALLGGATSTNAPALSSGQIVELEEIFTRVMHQSHPANSDDEDDDSRVFAVLWLQKLMQYILSLEPEKIQSAARAEGFTKDEPAWVTDTEDAEHKLNGQSYATLVDVPTWKTLLTECEKAFTWFNIDAGVLLEFGERLRALSLVKDRKGFQTAISSYEETYRQMPEFVQSLTDAMQSGGGGKQRRLESPSSDAAPQTAAQVSAKIADMLEKLDAATTAGNTDAEDATALFKTYIESMTTLEPDNLTLGKRMPPSSDVSLDELPLQYGLAALGLHDTAIQHRLKRLNDLNVAFISLGSAIDDTSEFGAALGKYTIVYALARLAILRIGSRMIDRNWNIRAHALVERRRSGYVDSAAGMDVDFGGSSDGPRIDWTLSARKKKRGRRKIY